MPSEAPTAEPWVISTAFGVSTNLTSPLLKASPAPFICSKSPTTEMAESSSASAGAPCTRSRVKVAAPSYSPVGPRGNSVMSRLPPRPLSKIPAAAITAPASAEVMRIALPLSVGATTPAMSADPLTPDRKLPLKPPRLPNSPRKSVRRMPSEMRSASSRTVIGPVSPAPPPLSGMRRMSTVPPVSAISRAAPLPCPVSVTEASSQSPACTRSNTAASRPPPSRVVIRPVASSPGAFRLRRSTTGSRDSRASRSSEALVFAGFDQPSASSRSARPLSVEVSVSCGGWSLTRATSIAAGPSPFIDPAGSSTPKSRRTASDSITVPSTRARPFCSGPKPWR